MSSLSGGEKKRLQLLTILFRNPNFLILDEPTNDLDLPTLGVLENFLSDYQGCLLIVSHDRYFMDRLVDHLFVFEGNGEIRDFPGNYTQYRLWKKEQEKLQVADYQSPGEEELSDIINQQHATSDLQPATRKKASFKEKREFELLEKEIAELETERQQIQNQLSDADAPYERLNLLSKRIGEISNLLNEKEMRWLELSEIM